jgi:hypothetical protein
MPPESPRNTPSIATSIGALQGTVQGLDVLRKSNGAAVTVGDDDLRRWVRQLDATSWRDIYVYFMHEPTAPGYAKALMEFAIGDK